LVNVDPKVVHDRINQESLSMGFSLKLPLSVYDITTGQAIEDLGNCRSDKSDSTGLNQLVGNVAPGLLQSLRKVLFEKEVKEAGDVATDTGALAGDPSTTPPGTPGRTSTPASTPARNQAMGQTSASPKMARLMGGTSTKVVTGYYGPFTFLDNQAAFDEVFGMDPVICSTFLLQKSATLREQIDEFVNACKFDVFISLCRNYYVGVGSNESDTQATHEACKAINLLTMEYKVHRRTIVDNPDVLFRKFMEVTPLLPDDASKWSTQLCSEYFNVLMEDLKARMENNNFIMPSLNALNKKKDQIDALQIVREESSIAFKKLNDETALITNIIARNGNGGANRSKFVTEESTKTLPPAPPSMHVPVPPTAEIFAYGQQSPAEETMQQYSSRTPNPKNLPV